MKPETTLLSAKELSIGYRTGKGSVKRVHEHLALSLHRGELVCLLGPNGAGKSTLLRTLSAAQPPLGGTLLLEGKPLKSYSEKDRSRMIGVVLTEKTQTGGLTVYELVALGRQPHTGFFGRLNDADRRIIDEAMEAVGITHKAGSYVAELSDGERQKALIAKALVQESPLIILDEPTAFLDVASRIETMTLLHDIARQQHKCILLSTHDVEQALILADRLWLLSAEGGLLCGVTEDVLLGGAMDSLFDRPDIRFDADHGIYYPIVHWQKKVELLTANDTLQHWATNALNRNGYACLPPGDEELTPDCVRLQVDSPTHLSLTDGQGRQQALGSFAELVEVLKR